MKAYIQTKSGNYNTEDNFPGIGTLDGVLRQLRRNGGFYSEGRDDKVIYVPFEEVEFVREAK